MNKNKKEINSLFQKLIKSIKITFEEDKNNLIYKDYFFNGIQIPNNIQFQDIFSNSFKLLWNIDNIDITNIDNKKIVYMVEIREKNKNFTKVYEGNVNNCLIENVNKNTNYEIRICCKYNDLIGPWSKIENIKTFDIDSIDSTILKKSKRKNEFFKIISKWSGYKNWMLIYRGTRDGSSSDIFHQKCGNQGPTICLYENSYGNIFGGFTSISWTSQGDYHIDKNCFIFTLTNNYNIEPTKFKIKPDIKQCVYHNIKEGPTFGGGEIGISKDFRKDECWSYFPSSFEDTTNKGNSIFTANNKKNNFFTIKEIEVFKLFE